MATSTTKTFDQLPKESAPFTHVAIITADDLTDPTDNSDQTVSLVIPAGSRIEDVLFDLVTPFKDADDATFDDLTLTVQDNAGSPIVFISAKQVAALAATPIRLAAMDKAAVAGQVYAAAAALHLIFNPETSNNLAELDTGEVRVYLNLQRRGNLG